MVEGVFAGARIAVNPEARKTIDRSPDLIKGGGESESQKQRSSALARRRSALY